MVDIKSFYDSPNFQIGEEPCLDDKMSSYRVHLEDIQESCNKINSLIDDDIKSTNERLK